MEIINIIGEGYKGYFDKVRIACRGIVIKNGMILLSHNRKHDLYMIPGGGLEEYESDDECVVRELSEETGMIIEATKCDFEVYEYYGDYQYITKYYIGNIITEGKPKLTDEEKSIGLEPKWIKLSEAIEMFKKYESYKDIDVMASGIYLREYKALCNI